MNIKENFTYFVAVLLFFGLSVFFAVKSRNSYVLLNKVKVDLILEKQKVHHYNERSKLKLFMDDTKLKPVVLLDTNNDSILIGDLVKTPKLIFRFSVQFCPPCIDAALKSLKSLGDSIGFSNILIISDIKNSRLLNTFIKNNQILSPCLLYSEPFNFEIEKSPGNDRTPYYIILDQNLKVSFPFFAEENDELNTIYLDRIRSLFNRISDSAINSKH